MRFGRFFQPKQNKPLHTVSLGDEHGTIKAGTTSHNQHYTKRKELEHNRQHVGAYHTSSIAQSHIANRQKTLPVVRKPHQKIDIMRRHSTVQHAPGMSQAAVGRHRFTEPPSRRPPR